MVMLFLLLALGAIGAWAGWDLGTRLYYRRFSFRRRLRILRQVLSITFAAIGVVLGILLLGYLGAFQGG